MTAHYTDDTVTLHYGDNRDVLAELADNSVDAIVTDPPYELGFMGKGWDSTGIAYDPVVWAQCLRVLKPGGHLLAFGGTRTWHRLACAIEDAGFEMRDSIAWLYGSGFPKSLDVSKAIDKRRDWSLVERLSGEIKRARSESAMSLAEIGIATLAATGGTYGKWYHRGGHMFFETGRSLPSRPEWDQLRHVLPITDEFIEVYDAAEREVVGVQQGAMAGWSMDGATRFVDRDITIASTAEAERWQGWGTALKPAFEPIVVARKPLIGTVAANVLRFGTGALNIDASRIGNEAGSNPHAGRWPANVVLDDTQADALDQQAGTLTSGANPTRRSNVNRGVYGEFSPMDDITPARGADSGGASRFFPVFGYTDDADLPTFIYYAKAPTSERPRIDGKGHVTVKPLGLIRWLVKLVTPPGGTVADPFAGSGTTGEACIIEGFKAILIENDAEHLPLIVQRVTKPIAPVLQLDGEA